MRMLLRTYNTSSYIQTGLEAYDLLDHVKSSVLRNPLTTPSTYIRHTCNTTVCKKTETTLLAALRNARGVLPKFSHLNRKRLNVHPDTYQPKPYNMII